MSDTMRIPPPLEWHPFYRHRTWLFDWLNGDPAYPSHHVNIVQPQPTLATFTTISDRIITLTKQKAVGAAPYVGRPFHYGWYYAADHLGRAVAGESFRIYPGGSIQR